MFGRGEWGAQDFSFICMTRTKKYTFTYHCSPKTVISFAPGNLWANALRELAVGLQRWVYTQRCGICEATPRRRWLSYEPVLRFA